MHPEVLKLMANKLTELVRKDLGYAVRFEWPEGPLEIGRKMTAILVVEQPLTPKERVKLEAWCQKNLGAEWPRKTIWDRLLAED